MLGLWATLVTEGAKAEDHWQSRLAPTTSACVGISSLILSVSFARIHFHLSHHTDYDLTFSLKRDCAGILIQSDGHTTPFFVEHEHEPNRLLSALRFGQPGRACQAGGGLVFPLWKTPLMTQCIGHCTWWRKLLATRVTRVSAQTSSSRFRDSRHDGDCAERISGHIGE
ncbi:hypothetical protein EDB86DRAFT_429163 [Lactarius hatsudake]|nr:hypothetical protein EDB86DRAFT_429163 [Lactarius hatsudake]